MLKTLTTAIMATLLSFPAMAMPKDEIAKFTKQVLTPSVQLGNFCSGTIIYSDELTKEPPAYPASDKKVGDMLTVILTAKHCVENVKKVTINVPVFAEDGTPVSHHAYVAFTKAMSYKDDLALIELVDAKTQLPVAWLAPKGTTLVRGEDIWNVGYPAGIANGQAWQKGEFTGAEFLQILYNDPFDKRYQRYTADGSPGNSGGSVYHMAVDGNYKLVSTHTGGYKEHPAINYGSRLDNIYALLETTYKDIYAPVLKYQDKLGNRMAAELKLGPNVTPATN